MTNPATRTTTTPATISLNAPVPVRPRIAEGMVPQIGPDAWAVDDVSFPKDGRMSVADAPQY